MDASIALIDDTLKPLAAAHERKLRRSVANAELLDNMAHSGGPQEEGLETRLARALRLFCANRDILPLLVVCKSVLGFSDDHGDTALHHAIWAGNHDIAMTLIAMTPPHELMTADSVGETPLHAAIQRCAPGIVSSLLSRGVNPHQPDCSGNTPLHLAVAGKNVAIVRLITEACVLDDRAAGVLGRYLTQANFAGDTVLHLAAASSSELFDVVIGPLVRAAQSTTEGVPERVAEVVAPHTRTSGRTPLHIAAAASRADIVHRLLSISRDIADVQDYAGNTALHLVPNHDDPCFKLLVDAGASTQIFNSAGLNALGEKAEWADEEEEEADDDESFTSATDQDL